MTRQDAHQWVNAVESAVDAACWPVIDDTRDLVDRPIVERQAYANELARGNDRAARRGISHTSENVLASCVCATILMSIKDVNLIDPQPDPVQAADAKPIWPMVIYDVRNRGHVRYEDTRALLIADMAERDAFGRAKYGKPLVAQNGRIHLADAYQEALDKLAYLRADIEECAHYETSEWVRKVYEEAIENALSIRAIIEERRNSGRKR